MNPKSPDRLTSADLARIIVGDTIRAAHTNPNLIKDATVEDSLEVLLEDKTGDQIVQSLLAEYALSEIAALNSGVIAMLDARVVNSDAVMVTAMGLKDELIQQLTEYLELPADEKQILVQGLLNG